MKVYSLGYSILKNIVAIPYHLFYKKIKVIGLENIPKGKPIIFAPNHQNALMDPLAMIFTTPNQIVFLARGDIFKGKKLIAFLNFIKILPVYRQHDGKEALKKNDAVFAESVDYLERRGSFCLFPEAKHNPHRNLRPLKKGIPRIAFQALVASNFELDIQVVPTGIYYDNKDNSGAYLQIKYGQPIAVKDYIEKIKDNEQKAMVALSNDMAPKIRPLIIDIPEDENYDLIEYIRTLYSPRLLKRFNHKVNDENKFLMDKALIEELNKIFIPDSVRFKVKDLVGELSINKIELTIVSNSLSFIQVLLNLLFFIILSPLAIVGLILNAVPFVLSKYLRTQLIKDPQFTSSIKFVVGAIIMPVYFLIIALLSLFFTQYYWSIALLFVMPILSYISYFYLKKIKWFYQFSKYRLSKKYTKIEKIKNELFIDLDKELINFKGM